MQHTKDQQGSKKSWQEQLEKERNIPKVLKLHSLAALFSNIPSQPDPFSTPFSSDPFFNLEQQIGSHKNVTPRQVILLGPIAAGFCSPRDLHVVLVTSASSVFPGLEACGTNAPPRTKLEPSRGARGPGVASIHLLYNPDAPCMPYMPTLYG